MLFFGQMATNKVIPGDSTSSNKICSHGFDVLSCICFMMKVSVDTSWSVMVRMHMGPFTKMRKGRPTKGYASYIFEKYTPYI